MGMLKSVTTGKVKKPLFGMVYGLPGVGKSQFASDSPKPIFIGAEDGTHHLDVSRFPEPKSFVEIRNMLAELLKEEHPYKTVVLDSLDWIEPLVFKAVCDLDGSSSIDKAQGGYGKGFTEAQKMWRFIISDLSALRETKKMNIILIAHSQVKSFNDPTMSQPYDRHQPKINDKASALWVEACDFVLFATYETFLKTDKDQKRNRAMGDGKRVVYTEYRPAFTAKNRLGLPFELPLSYSDFVAAADSGKPESLESVLSAINSLTALVGDAATKKKVEDAIAKAANDVTKLEPILNRLRVVTGG